MQSTSSIATGRRSGHQLARLTAELEEEWPTLYRAGLRLRRGQRLSPEEEAWLREAARAAGWRMEDMEEELRGLDQPPAARLERYRRLLEDYLREADRHAAQGDTRQAGEKLWGAATALVKLHAAQKNIPVMHWSRAKLDRFIVNNADEELRSLLLELLDTAQPLHEYFYEGGLSPEVFAYRYQKARRLIEKAKKLIYEKLAR